MRMILRSGSENNAGGTKKEPIDAQQRHESSRFTCEFSALARSSSIHTLAVALGKSVVNLHLSLATSTLQSPLHSFTT
jgi:hypothetical protein